MSVPDYSRFIERVQRIVHSYGKQMIGWEEINQSRLLSGSIVQYWRSDSVQSTTQPGTKVIISPASKAYLDMKYNNSTTLGQDWAGTIEVKDAYCWDPVTQVNRVEESNILGLEAPLWTETIQTMAEVEYMAFPRLAGYAEIGWSRAAARSWDEYKTRLGEHGLRLAAFDVKFYRSPQIPWR
jgi:hexosaminidase